MFRYCERVIDLDAEIADRALDLRVAEHADQLFRILFNLLHNAASVARRRGRLKTVDVSIERTAASVVLLIADDGTGLPASVRKQLFRAGVPSCGGSGLGLSIARELAGQNGGTLRLARPPGAQPSSSSSPPRPLPPRRGR